MVKSSNENSPNAPTAPRKDAMAKRKKELDGHTFDVLSNRVRTRINADIEAEDPTDRLSSSKPLTHQQRSGWRSRTEMGRPKIGQGHKVVSISPEAGLLK